MNHIDYELIGKRLKTFRKKKKLTQNHLSEELHYSTGYLSQIERGLTRPNLDTLALICNTLNVDIAMVISNANYSPQYLENEFMALLEKLDVRERRRFLAMLEAYVEQKNKEF